MNNISAFQGMLELLPRGATIKFTGNFYGLEIAKE